MPWLQPVKRLLGVSHQEKDMQSLVIAPENCGQKFCTMAADLTHAGGETGINSGACCIKEHANLSMHASECGFQSCLEVTKSPVKKRFMCAHTHGRSAPNVTTGCVVGML